MTTRPASWFGRPARLSRVGRVGSWLARPSLLAATVLPERVLAWPPAARVLAVADLVAGADTQEAQAQRMALFAFAVRIVSAFILYASQVVLARMMGAFEYGIFVLVWVAAVIGGNVACLGFPSAVIRFVPRYLNTGETDALRGLVLGARLFAFAAATLLAGLALAALHLLGERVTDYYVVPFALGALALPMLSLGDTQDGVSRSFSFKALALGPTFLLRPTLILVAMVAAVWWGWPATAATALAAALFATWATSLVQLAWLARTVRRAVAPGPRAYAPAAWLAVALPIFLVEGFFQLLTNVDILMVGRFMAPGEVAVYYAAVKTLALVHFVYFAVKAGAAHRYSHYHSLGDRGAYEHFVAQTVKWTFWPSLAMSALVLAAGPMLLSLFGEGFERGYPLLLVLVVGIVARAAVGPAESVLSMSGEQRVCAVVYGVTLVVNIALNVALIPAYGLLGAAAATTGAMLFEAGALYAVVLRRLDLHMFVAQAHGRTA